MNNPEILIIDDEAQIRRLLEITLQRNDYTVRTAATAREGLQSVANHPPDAVILDIGLPDESGHIVLKKLREWYTRPVLILSVQSDEEDIVSALDHGANDYLIKPFRTGELLARLRSALRFSNRESDHYVVGNNDLMIDLDARTVTKNGEAVKLTATEFTLLALLAEHEGSVLTHQFLLRQVWGLTFSDQTQYLRVYIAQLRKKLETDPNRPQHILTESKIGYRFNS